MRVLSIDPSIANIGVAVIEDRQLVTHYTFKTDELSETSIRIAKISAHFRAYETEFDYVLIEMPDTFVRKGLFGIKNMSSLMLLFISIGAISASLADRYHVRFVRVSDWKKSTGKKVTQFITSELTGLKLNTHESDAYVMAINWLDNIRFKEAIERTRNGQMSVF